MPYFILYILLSSFAIGSFSIIDTLFLLNIGLSWQDIALLSSVLNIGILFAELPTGIIADKIGVFKAIYLGTLCRALACFCYIVKFPQHLIIASILASVGIAFLSGAINAAAISLKNYSSNNNLSHIISTESLFANIRYYKSMATLLGGLCGYYLFNIHNHYVWILSGAILIISTLSIHPLIKQFNFNTQHQFSLRYLKDLSIAQLKTPIFWACVLISISAVAPMMTWQVLFHQFNHGLLLGFLLLNTATLFSSFLLKKYILPLQAKYIILIANIILLTCIPIIHNHLILLAFFLFFHIFCHSAGYTFVFAQFHDNIDDKARNSLESLSSALDSILVVPIYFISAYFLDKQNLLMAFLLSASIFLIMFILYLYSTQKITPSQ